MNLIDIAPVAFAICVIAGVGLFVAAKVCEYLDNCKKEAQLNETKRKDEEMNRLLNQRPQAITSYLMFKAEIEAVMRQVGSKEAAVKFTI